MSSPVGGVFLHGNESTTLRVQHYVRRYGQVFWKLFYDLLHDKIRMPVYNENGRKRIFDPNLSWNSNRASGLVLLKFINFMIKG